MNHGTTSDVSAGLIVPNLDPRIAAAFKEMAEELTTRSLTHASDEPIRFSDLIGIMHRVAAKLNKS